LKHPLRHPLPWVVLAALVVTLVILFLLPESEYQGPDTWPWERPDWNPQPAGAAPAGPEWQPDGPVRAFDDFQLGVHLRYLEAWGTRAPSELPPGPPGKVLVAVGPPDSQASVVLMHFGPMVPRAGVEAIARRSAEMAGAEIQKTVLGEVGGTEAIRVTATADGHQEEAAFFNHRGSLLAVRLIAPEAEEGAMETLSEALGGLYLD
jgi:hypothetical protein